MISLLASVSGFPCSRVRRAASESWRERIRDAAFTSLTARTEAAVCSHDFAASAARFAAAETSEAEKTGIEEICSPVAGFWTSIIMICYRAGEYFNMGLEDVFSIQFYFFDTLNISFSVFPSRFHSTHPFVLPPRTKSDAPLGDLKEITFVR